MLINTWQEALLVLPSDREGNKQKLKHRRFCLNKRKRFSTVGVVEHWSKLLREVLEASLEIFEAQLDVALGNLL